MTKVLLLLIATFFFRMGVLIVLMATGFIKLLSIKEKIPDYTFMNKERLHANKGNYENSKGEETYLREFYEQDSPGQSRRN